MRQPIGAWRQGSNLHSPMRDLPLSGFANAQLPAALFRRCRHVVTENTRALAAAEALRAGDPRQMGWLMRQSPESLRLDYEISTEKFDALVAIADELPGIYGSRLTGAGEVEYSA